MEPPKKRRKYLIAIENSSPKSSGFDLPDELTFHIFSFLKASDIVRAKSVCVSWNKLSLPINYCNEHESKCSVESLIYFSEDVEKIYIRGRNLPKGFFTMIRLFKNLRQLHLHRCVIEESFFDLYQLRLLPKLNTLGLWRANVKADDFKNLIHLKELRFLDLTSTSIDNDTLRLIIENLPKLRQICLLQCRAVTADAFNINGKSYLQKICFPFSNSAQKTQFSSYKDRYPDFRSSGCNIDHGTCHVFNLVSVHPELTFF